MRIAVSGSHSTGKSSLIAGFIAKCPEYIQEPEAYEVLADEVDHAFFEDPSPECLRALLDHTIGRLELYEAGARVIFERCPVDYLAYAEAASSNWGKAAAAAFLAEAAVRVRESLRRLEWVVFLPLSSKGAIGRRPGENEPHRRAVDNALRRALLDDAHDLFEDASSAGVLELVGEHDTRLARLTRLVKQAPVAAGAP
jgi:hypothetical protein